MTMTNIPMPRARTFNAILFSSYPNNENDRMFVSKLIRYGVKVTRVCDPNKTHSFPTAISDIDIILIAARHMRPGLSAVARKFADNHNLPCVGLRDQSSHWGDCLGPALANLPDKKDPPAPKPPTVLTLVHSPEPVEEIPKIVIEEPRIVEPTYEELKELCVLYSEENAALKQKLVDVSASTSAQLTLIKASVSLMTDRAKKESVDAVDEVNETELQKKVRTQAAYLANKTRVINRLEQQVVELEAECTRLKNAPPVTLSPVVVEEVPPSKSGKEQELESELTKKRALVSDRETQIKAHKETIKSLQNELKTLQEDLVRAKSAQPVQVITVPSTDANKMVELMDTIGQLVQGGILSYEEAWVRFQKKVKE